MAKALLLVGVFLTCMVAFNFAESVIGKFSDIPASENITEADVLGGKFNDEELDKLLHFIDKSDLALHEKESARSGVRRLRRATEPKGKQWCCKITKPKDQQAANPDRIVRARVVQKKIKQGGSIKCGFLGLSRCSSTRDVMVSVTEYYTDIVYAMIPAPDWTNGCPTAQISCCKGHGYYPVFKNCLEFHELENLLKVTMKYQEQLAFLASLSSFY